MKRRNKIRLTESQLNRVIKESVKKVLEEMKYGTIEDMEEPAQQINMLRKAFGLPPTNLSTEEDVTEGKFRTKEGITIEYYNDYPNKIECDASIGGRIDDDTRYELLDYIEHHINLLDGWFRLDTNYSENSNFVRFCVIPFNQ